eukprot:4109210-Prymnesium_polylepis.1
MVLSASHMLSVEPLGSGDGRAYRIKLPVPHLHQPNVRVARSSTVGPPGRAEVRAENPIQDHQARSLRVIW